MIREVVYLLKSLVDDDLPLTKPETLFKLGDNLDWSESFSFRPSDAQIHRDE